MGHFFLSHEHGTFAPHNVIILTNPSADRAVTTFSARVFGRTAVLSFLIGKHYQYLSFIYSEIFNNSDSRRRDTTLPRSGGAKISDFT